jgi:hypothetical protein
MHNQCVCPDFGEHASGAGRDHDSTPCLTFGVCVCSVVGRVLLRLRQSFVKAFKTRFPHNGPERKRLAQAGFVVCHVFSKVGDSIMQMWWHIGLLYLSPLRPTYLTLFEIVREPPDDTSNHPPRVVLSVREDGALTFDATEALIEFKALQLLDFGRAWEVQYYMLEDSSRPIPVMDAGRVTALVDTCGPLRFWGRKDADEDVDEAPDDVAPHVPLYLDETDEEDEEEHEGDAHHDDELDIDEILVHGTDDEAGGSEMPVAFDEPPTDDLHEPPAVEPAEAPPYAPPPPDALVLIDGLVDHDEIIVHDVAVGRARGHADITWSLFGGTMNYYIHDQRFTAVCGNPLHGHCVLTRHARARAHMKGRPVTMLYGFLSVAEMCDTKEEHWSFISALADDLDERIAIRILVADIPIGRRLLLRQLQLRDGEVDTEEA